MTQDRTTTEEATRVATETAATADAPDAVAPAAAGDADTPARATTAQADEPTRTEAPPAGTRELRDAQQGRSAGTADRPAIRAEGGASTTPAGDRNAPLFDEAAGGQLRERWTVIQTEFVDEPKAAVEKADALVAEVLQQLTDSFARERESLEAGWSGGDGSGGPGAGGHDLTTEDLRQAIQRYRSFFNRLLSF